jgi:hypothetical protein
MRIEQEVVYLYSIEAVSNGAARVQSLPPPTPRSKPNLNSIDGGRRRLDEESAFFFFAFAFAFARDECGNY